MEERRSRRAAWLAALVVLLLAVGGGVAFLTLGGGAEEAKAQTVRFQAPTDNGPSPFTEPAERRGPKRVKVGSGPFGGTGSDLVCDRELLIRSLAARPDRLVEWARVLGVTPTRRAVAKYIRRLRPVTLTRDTRVTNHSFVGGRAVAFQSILQAGTAVLVDQDGVPVARCRCGNPLLKPIFIAQADCFGCPANYTPPPPCKYYDYDDRDFGRYGDAYWKRVFVATDFVDACYLPYPDPPTIRGTPARHRRPPKRAPEEQLVVRHPAASFSPASGISTDTYTLYASGFRPNVTLAVRLTRPDGVGESYSITTSGGGSGAYTFPRASNPVLGTYTATITDPGTGDTASASTTVSAAPEAAPPPPTDQLQCDPPRSQLEAEQCAAREGNAPQDTPVPDDQLHCNPPRSQLEAEQCAGVD
ncbi:MAG: hypothetical protein QOD13_3058 [Thermoleophilaceae bacterium]|jgi:hypothetical protein|nr:hypothetical protein [Thermoleophilaceae bacterium]